MHVCVWWEPSAADGDRSLDSTAAYGDGLPTPTQKTSTNVPMHVCV